MDSFKKAKEIFQATLQKQTTLLSQQNEMSGEALILELEEIIEAYTTSIQLYKPQIISPYTNRGKARVNLAELYLYQNRDGEALELLDLTVYDFCRVKVDDTENYIAERFYSGQVQKKMTELYQKQGNEQEYLICMQFTNEDYQAILEIEPDNFDALNSISFNDFEMARDYYMPRDKTVAIALFKKALKNYLHILKLKYTTDTLFDISALYSRMAEVYDGLGEYHNAIESFQNAIKYCQKFLKEKYDLEVLVNMSIFQSDMAKIYSLIGKKREALEYYDDSIKNSLQAIEEESHVITLNNLAISYSEKADIYSSQGVINKDISLIQKAIKLLSFLEESQSLLTLEFGDK